MTPDPEKVKEAWQMHLENRHTVTERAVIASVVEVWLSGTDIQWCVKHDSKSRDGEVCEAAINTAFRLTRNPFDKPTCRVVTRRLSGGTE